MDRRQFLLAAGTGAALGLSTTSTSAQLVRKLADDLKNGEFNWFPERSASGPVLIIVSTLGAARWFAWTTASLIARTVKIESGPTAATACPTLGSGGLSGSVGLIR